MSLRLRLILVVLAVAVPTGAASLISFLIHRGIQERVARLGPRATIEVDASSIVGRTLSIEGRWDESGFFAASAIEELPLSRRPKLRGEIRSIDTERRSLTIHGRIIQLTEQTELSPAEPAGPLATLAVGRRVEVSCSVDREGAWLARKVETEALKKTDKIKGTITRAAAGSRGEMRLELDGLPIVVPPHTEIVSPSGPLHRTGVAAGMALAVQECLATAQELLKERYRRRDALDRGDEERVAEGKRAIEDAEDRLLDAHEEFAHYLAESRSAAEEEIRSGADAEDRSEAEEEIALWLAPLEAERSPFAENVARFVELTSSELDVAQEFLPDVLEPHLRGSILPLVHSYQSELEEEFSQELQSVSSRSVAAARVAVTTIIVGLVLAVVLGLFVARSISGPIGVLEAAARRIGAGNLATRVDVRSADEIGVLAQTFNRMAEQLAATTVSVGNLNSAIDSMAGALFLLGPDGEITSVNPAASSLLGYRHEELVGTSFRTICSNAGTRMEAAGEDGWIATGERVFRTKDGLAIPVSFSGAALRDERGAVRGYVCLAQDLTDRKRLEQDLRRSLSEKELLLQEVHHRVKNNLQVISSLLDLQSRSISDSRSLEKFQESQDRIRSMVLIHDQLYRENGLEAVHMRAYLELLVANLAQSHIDRSRGVRLRVEVDDLSLDLDRALACGLIVNELVTNACKHAFSSEAPGEILVTCLRADAGRIALAVSDDGRGLREEDGAGTSLGMSLVEALTKQLRGRLARNGAHGTAFRVEFPATGLAEVT